MNVKEKIRRDLSTLGVLRTVCKYARHFYVHHVYNYAGYVKRRICPGKFCNELGKEYEYAYSTNAVAWQTERVLEIPLALEVYKQYHPRNVLEVGNVLHNYYDPGKVYDPGSDRCEWHDVVDLFEKHDGVINEDICAYDPGRKYKLILCISTLEHVGEDADGVLHASSHKLFNAYSHMLDLLEPGGLLFATVPVGQNTMLDDMIKTGLLFKDVRGYNRIGFDIWVPGPPNWDAKTDDPYPCANTVIVCRAKKD